MPPAHHGQLVRTVETECVFAASNLPCSTPSFSSSEPLFGVSRFPPKEEAPTTGRRGGKRRDRRIPFLGMRHLLGLTRQSPPRFLDERAHPGGGCHDGHAGAAALEHCRAAQSPAQPSPGQGRACSMSMDRTGLLRRHRRRRAGGNSPFRTAGHPRVPATSG